MAEKEWKELAEAYSREAAEEFQKTVNTYYEKKAAQQARRDSAKNAVGKVGRPVLEEIQKERDLAETEYLEAEKIYNQLRMDSKDDGEILAALSSRLEERKAVVEEHARIDALYRMTSGKSAAWCSRWQKTFSTVKKWAVLIITIGTAFFSPSCKTWFHSRPPGASAP